MGLDTRAQTVLYQGEDLNLVIRLLEDDENGEPFDISQASEILVKFPMAQASPNSPSLPLIKTLSSGQVQVLIGSAGKFNVTLAAADSLLLKVTEELPIEITVIINGRAKVIQIKPALAVRPTLFPAS